MTSTTALPTAPPPPSGAVPGAVIRELPAGSPAQWWDMVGLTLNNQFLSWSFFLPNFVIGLLEMIYFLVSAPTGQSTRRLFWVLVNVKAVTPWLVFAAITVAGALGARRAMPHAAAAFADASRTASGR